MHALYEIEQLNEADDPRLSDYRDLRWNRKADAKTRDFIVEGRYCVERLLQSDYAVHSILVTEGKRSEFLERVNKTVPVYSLPLSEIRKLVGFDFHRGIMACAKRPALNSITSFVHEQSNPSITIAMIGISERENAGSIMRTSAALGVQRILLGPNTADPFARRTIRVSMGSVFRLKLYDLCDPASQLPSLAKQHGLRTIVTTLAEDATPLRDFRLAQHSGILIAGNEAEGVAEEIQKVATDRVIIPMHQGTNSLNVAVATAICLHELTHQRGH